MLPDFNRLKVFYFIHFHRSIVKAAKVLHVTQPALSQQLKKLEQELETPLFTRLHKQLIPTQAGEKLFELVAPFVEQLEKGIQGIQRAKEEPQGLLRIGAPVEFGQKYLPEWFAAYRKRYPEVRFSLELGHPNELLPGVGDGSLDFCFVDIFASQRAFAQQYPLFAVETLFTEEMILCCSKDYYHQQLDKGTLLKALQKADHIAYKEHAPSIKSWYRHHFGLSSFSPRIVLTVESVRAAIAGVHCHMGLAVVPSHLLQDALQSGDSIRIPSQQAPQMNQVALIQLQDKLPTLTEKSFIRHCKQTLSKQTILDGKEAESYHFDDL